MRPLLRRLRTILLVVPPALLLACTDVIEAPAEGNGGAGFGNDTGTGGGNPGGNSGNLDSGGTGGGDTLPTGDTGPEPDVTPSEDTASPGDTTPAGDDADVAATPDAGADPDTGGEPDAGGACSELEASYGVALASAKSCTADGDCKQRRPGDPGGCTCDTWVTAAGSGAVDAIAAQYEGAGCTLCTEPPACPTLANARCIEGVCTVPTKPPLSCDQLATAYKAEINKAKACTGSEQCRVLTEGALVCGCSIYINEDFDTTEAKSLASQFHAAQCPEGDACAACAEPLVGVCSGGKCITKTKAP